MSDDTTSLSPRHERCVEEYLKDSNATQPYIRAGCAPRGVPSCSSMMHIEATIAVGRQRVTQALEISVERIAAECAKAAFANVDDFVEVDAEGRLRIALAKASRAQRIGMAERTVADHGKQWQRVELKLGKLSRSTTVGAGNPGARGNPSTRCLCAIFCALAKPGDHSKPCQSDHRSGGNGQARGSTG